LAGTLLFAKVLLYFGLGCWMLEFFTHVAVIQRAIDVSPAFLKHGPAEKITVWAHTNSDRKKQEVGFIFE
jgi:hypothetical protein